MKLTVEIGRDEELRKEILEMIRKEVRTITGQEIRDMVDKYMSSTDITARVVAAFKDVVSKQVDLWARSYGQMAAQDILKKRFDEVVQANFDTFFQKQCIPFLKDYLKKNLESVGGVLGTFKAILEKPDDPSK